MAEAVNMILEGMLPHLEELQRVGIFNESEIRDIVNRRRHMEYKLFRRPPKKEDFLKAIEYEINLDKLRKLRKERMGVVSSSEDGEFGIANRIHGLYRRATKHFKGDINLWLKHIQHTKQLNQQSMMGRLYGKALSIHSTHVGLWIMAAKFEFEERQDANAARTLFLQGLRVNSSCKKLWLEYYRMELMTVDKLRKRRNILLLEDEIPAPDDVMNYGLASIVYCEAIKAIDNDIDFRLSFLPILVLFENTEDKEQEIYDNLLTDFPNSALVHDSVARRCWLRVMEIESVPVDKIKLLESQTEVKYEKSIEALSTTNVYEEECLLWEKYLQWCIQRLHYWSLSNDNVTNRISKLFDKCCQACSKGLIKEELPLMLLSTLQSYNLSDVACSFVHQMVVTFPSSAKLWLARLQCEAVIQTDFESLSSLCEKALSCIPKESSLPVWQFYIKQAIVAQTSNDTIENIFEMCLKTSDFNTSETILYWYLDWVYITSGISKLRSIYKRFSKDLSASLLTVQVFMKFIDFEKNQQTINTSKLCGLFEDAINEYGTICPDLWIDYINTMTKIGSVDSLKLVSVLYWRAIKMLDGSLTAEFISKHSMNNL